VNKSLFVAAPSWVRFLYTQNPFYLVGTFLVMFGFQQCLGREPSLATSRLLVEMLAGYTVLLTVVAMIVVRWGQVWDDARTILLVIVLLLCLLSTCLDFHFLHTFKAPWPGTQLLALGWAFSVLVSETVLRGLRICLTVRYRLAYYLVLSLLFAYPMFLGWMNYHGYYDALPWALLAFPAVVAMALLTLLPEAQTPAWRQPKTGTPWIWPYYPWSLFIFLTIGVAIRTWWLTISFEPAMGPDTYFQPYFLLPLVLAWAALVLEMGLAQRSPGAVAASLLLPLAGLATSFSGPGRGEVEIEFLHRLTATLGSPPQLAVWGVAGFYGWSWLRGVRACEGFLIATGLLASVVDYQTVDADTFAQPQPLILAAIAAVLFVRAIRRDSTWRAGLAAGLAVATARLSGANLGAVLSSNAIWFWQWHAPVVALLFIAAIFDDPLARFLRSIVWRVVPLLAFAAVIVYPPAMPQLDEPLLTGYVASLLVASFAIWLRQRQVGPLGAGIATLGANVLAYFRQMYLLLAYTPLAKGLPWIASGLVVVTLAVLISLLKMGLWVRSRQWLERLNLALARISTGKKT
jgi:hypothetical protein